ncbi:hypothetical protein [Bradyrhizobium zhanjiangense]|uniref:hypothetical protein n=1 Tax=Bradyrhizobium zhanjiangense TaxID=1325107 RepID=UPI0013E8A56F|nr:hypothetical protein [Bradyrhizobium zhanjiangense]
MIQRQSPVAPAKLIAKRKAAYEAVHPETRHGGSRRGSSRQIGELKDRFTADTSAKTGKPERSIQRDATRAKALGPDLDRVVGTSLDKGAELDALAAMSAAARSEVIGRASASENVSALRPASAQEPKPGLRLAAAERCKRAFDHCDFLADLADGLLRINAGNAVQLRQQLLPMRQKSLQLTAVI